MSLPLIECFENYGLVGEANIYRFFKTAKRKQLVALREDIERANREDRDTLNQVTPSIFNFFASSSIRGDFGCSEPRCRLRKIASLERFSGLYSDHLVLPLYVGNRLEEPNSQILLGSALIVDRLRPAIDGGLITPVSNSVCLCPRCAAAKYESADSHFVKLVDAFAEHYASEVEIVFQGSKKERQFRFEVRGPATILAGTVQLKTYIERPEWMSGLRIRPGQILPTEIVKKSRMVHELYRRGLFECSVHDYYSDEYACTYLSDSVGEAEMLSALGLGDLDESAQMAYQITQQLSHEIPMFADLPTSALLQLRNEMPEAFAGYRHAINAAFAELKAKNVGGPVIARELYKDLLLPRIDALRNAEKAADGLKFKNVLAGLTIPALTVAFGWAFGLPAHVNELLGTVGGFAALNAVVDPIRERNKKQAEVKADSMFFLLEMDKKWRKTLSCSRSLRH